MEIKCHFISGDNCEIPAILIRPSHPCGSVIIVHGYGGNKEEQLGLGFQIAKTGLLSCVIDLRGHGEHPLKLDGDIRNDLEAAIRFCRPFGKITVVGHSLGGRLALLSNVDYCIAISPSLSKKYSEQTREMLKVMRSYRVRPSDIMNLLTLQEELPVWKAEHHKGEVLILYAERDAPEISEGCQLLKNKGTQVIRIEKAMHSDVFLVKQTFVTIREQIRKWYDNTIVD